MLGGPESPFTITVVGHAMSVWDNIIVIAVFGRDDPACHVVVQQSGIIVPALFRK
jgi:hypothetical protein